MYYWIFGYSFGIMTGVIIGLEYYRHQVVIKKNPKVISKVKRWLEEAGK